jgi:CRP-like cAMP-binding protein
MGQPPKRKAVRTTADAKSVGGATDFRNRLLLSLAPSESETIHSLLEPCELRHHKILQEPTEPVQYVYFPNSGLISLVVETEDGSTVEVGMVGREGFAGLAGAVGLSRTPLRQIVQIGGEGYRMKVGALERFLNVNPGFQQLVCRYAVVLGMQMAQTAACNRLHDAFQRLTRWLLMARDRGQLNELPVTHEFLSTVLGTDRPSVTLAAQTLQKRGIVEYRRGKIVILNARKLEAASCECYRVIRTLGHSAMRVS